MSSVVTSIASQAVATAVHHTTAVVTNTTSIAAATATMVSNIIIPASETIKNQGIFPSNIDLGSGGSQLLVGNAENQSGIGTQLIICFSAGLIFFLSFCFLRTRLPVIFAPRNNMERHKPPELPTSFFGWIIPMLKIKNEDMLNNVGLDAVLMLHFLSMGIKIFGVSSFFGIVILIPISMTSTSATNVKPIDRLSITVVHPGSSKLIAYLVFVYLITIVTFLFLKDAYDNYVYLRARFLLNNAASLHSRSVIVTGIPEEIATDEGLSKYYENLGVGSVRSCYVVRTVHRLHKLIQMRANALLKLETAYATYWGNPCAIPGYDPDKILDDVELYKRVLQIADETDSIKEKSEEEHKKKDDGGVDADLSKSGELVGSSSAVEEPKKLKKRHGMGEITFFKVMTETKIKKKSKRPTNRIGLFGLFGKKVDSIEYYTKLFDDLDKTIIERRLTPNYDLTSVGFVTFESMSSAVIVSQIAINPKPFACDTMMAYEPKDILWNSVSITGRERIVRECIIWAITIVLVVLWFVPVVFLSSLVSIDMINKIAPSVARTFQDNPFLNNVITSFVPTLLINVVTSVLPMIFDALGYFQGIRARSALAEATLSKYFFFLVFFTLIVFTLAGSSINALLLSFAKDPSSIPTKLAKSLTTISPFFINYVILQGIMLMPLNLLLLGALFTRGFSYLFCKTPRDFAENTAPWALNYGMAYPAPLLVFVIVLEYSTISPLILLFGTLYFTVAYFVYKYQFLYVYFRPYEAAGRLWKKIIPRIVFGLVLFQLTMCGLFAIKSFYILSILCIPLIVATFIFLYVLDQAFYENGSNMPMQLLRDNLVEEYDSSDDDSRGIISPLDTTSAEPGTSAKAQLKNDQNGISVSTVEVAKKHGIQSKWKSAALNAIKLTSKINREEDEQIIRPRHVKLTLDQDDYRATPNKNTDYRQPPMKLNPGLLDTGLKKYGNPLLVGVLPQLWLPVKKLVDGETLKTVPEDRRLSDGDQIKELSGDGNVANRLAELLRKMEDNKVKPSPDPNTDSTTLAQPTMDDSAKIRRQSREIAHSDAAIIVEGKNAKINALRDLFHRGAYKSKIQHPDQDHPTESQITNNNDINLEEKGEHVDSVIPTQRPEPDVAVESWKKLHQTYYHHKKEKPSDLASSSSSSTSSCSAQLVPDTENTMRSSVDLTNLRDQCCTTPSIKEESSITIPLDIDSQDEEH